MKIPFNKPFMTGKELWYIAQAHAKGHLAGAGEFTIRCQKWLETRTTCTKALLTHSCTAALEMTALLANLNPGDEVIMPSYTFVSTANAFVLRGAVPVFIDIRPDTLNMDESLLEEAITEKTKVIVPVHYAGVSCEMDSILEIAKQKKVMIIEDAAQGIMSTYKGKPLGSIGDLGALSFHETKNLISGEGGSLLINSPSLINQAEIIWEKGTDRSRFFRGEVDKYTWQDIGSSYLPSELVAAFLWAQFEEADSITKARLQSWCYYNDLLIGAASKGLLRLPIVSNDCQHNAHMYYILLPPQKDRERILEKMKEAGIGSIFHYVPLHSSAAGIKFSRAVGRLPVTVSTAKRLIRLPLWCGILPKEQEIVVETLLGALES